MIAAASSLELSSPSPLVSSLAKAALIALLAARLAKASGDDAAELAHASDAITQAGQIQGLASANPTSL